MSDQKTTEYGPLLEGTDEQVKRDLDPRDAARLVRRLRHVSFFMQLNAELVTKHNDDGTYRAYNVMDSIKVPARTAIEVLEKWADFNDRKAADGQNVGTIEVTRLSECLFIG